MYACDRGKRRIARCITVPSCNIACCKTQTMPAPLFFFLFCPLVCEVNNSTPPSCTYMYQYAFIPLLSVEFWGGSSRHTHSITIGEMASSICRKTWAQATHAKRCERPSILYTYGCQVPSTYDIPLRVKSSDASFQAHTPSPRDNGTLASWLLLCPRRRGCPRPIPACPKTPPRCGFHATDPKESLVA